MAAAESQGSRISQRTFTIVQFLFLALALIAAAVKIFLRIRWASRPSVDDGILCVAVIFLTASVALFYNSLDLIYYVFNPGVVFEPAQYLQFSRLVDASAVLSWTTIYLVKLSFVWFFRALTDRMPRMRIHWWVVSTIVVICAPISMFFTFFICHDFSLNTLQSCGNGINFRIAVYLNLTAALDIFTDVLILSIPIALLWKVKIDLKRKLGLAAVLCLSSFMIAIQIIRASLAYIIVPIAVGPPEHQQVAYTSQLDESWMFFWLNMEAAVSIVMVSVTAFKSMLGRKSSTYGYVSSGSRRYRRSPGGNLSGTSSSGHHAHSHSTDPSDEIRLTDVNSQGFIEKAGTQYIELGSGR